MIGIVKIFDGKSGKGFIILFDGCIDVQFYVLVFNFCDVEEIIIGLCVEFCWINGLCGFLVVNVYFL